MTHGWLTVARSCTAESFLFISNAEPMTKKAEPMMYEIATQYAIVCRHRHIESLGSESQPSPSSHVSACAPRGPADVSRAPCFPPTVPGFAARHEW